MALLYRAFLTPSKLELFADWLPRQDWASGVPGSAWELLGSYRFDDPDGQVGIETHLFGGPDDRVVQLPVTYRDGPLPGAESALIGTTEHSVLGTRFVYDGCADPVCLQAFATTIFTGGVQADLDVAETAADADQGRTVRRELVTLVQGSGTAVVPPVLDGPPEVVDSPRSSTVLRFPQLDLTVVRQVGGGSSGELSGDTELELEGETELDLDGETLLGTWPGQDTPTLLAFGRRSL